MKINGQARKNGIDFFGAKYKVALTVKKDKSVSTTSKKQSKVTKLFTFLDTKLFLRTVSLLLKIPLLAIILIVFAAFDIFSNNKNEVLNFSIMIFVFPVFTVCILRVLMLSLSRNRQGWKYHGAEHKTINAVERGVPLDIDSVKECPRVSNRCGTNLVILSISTYIIFQIAASTHDVLNYYSVRHVLPILMAYELYKITNGDTKPILKYFYRVSFWLQDKFLTKEPEEYQLKVAITAIKELVDLENGEEVCFW
jgi:uncharacterized protein YqhQ